MDKSARTKIIYYIVFVAIFLCIIMLPSGGSEENGETTITYIPSSNAYTPSSETHCDNGECVSTNYVGLIFYENENGDWNRFDTSIKELNINYNGYDLKYGNEQGNYKAYFDESKPTSVFKFKDYALIQSPSYVGWYDTSSKNWDVMQGVQSSEAVVGESSINYPNSFYGIDINYTYQKRNLKEIVTISEDTKTYIQNNYPNIPSPETKWFVVANKLELINVGMTKDGQDIIEGSTIEGQLDFSDVADDLKFFFPLGYAWDSNKEENCNYNSTDCFDVKWRIVKQNDDWYILYGIPLTWFSDKQFPIYVDPTTYIVTLANVNTAEREEYGTDTPRDIGHAGYLGYTGDWYGNVSASDDERNSWDTSDAQVYWYNLWYNFTINEAVEEITSLYVEWEGYDELDDGDDFEFDIWNYTSSAWQVINTTTTPQSSDILYGTTFTSGFSDFIVGGFLHLAVSGDYSPQSCPYIYSWDGSNYVLDSEMFPWSWTKYWNVDINARLPSLQPYSKECDIINKIKDFFWLENNCEETYRIKVSEEMDEVAYYDKVQLIAIDHQEGTEVYSDINNNYYTIENPKDPISCVDESGRDCLSLVSNDDEEYWNLGGEFKEEGTDYEDYMSEIIVEFEREGDEVKLLHKAKKSGLLSHRFGKITYGKTGYNNRDYMFIDKVLEWMGLVNYIFPNIYLWNGTEWVDIYFLSETMALTEAQERIVSINLTDIDTETLKIKYSALDEIAGIDYVKADWSKNKIIDTTVLNISSAEFTIGGETSIVTEKLLGDDEDYLVFNEGDYGYIDFEPIESNKNSKRTFFTIDNGYYDALVKLIKEHNKTFDGEDKEILNNMMSNYSYALEYLVSQLYHNTLYEDFVQVQVTTAPTDTCTCVGIDTNWEINMTDGCNITSNCDLNKGNLTFIDEGYVNCSANINTSNMGEPPSGATVTIVNSSCIIHIKPV